MIQIVTTVGADVGGDTLVMDTRDVGDGLILPARDGNDTCRGRRRPRHYRGWPVRLRNGGHTVTTEEGRGDNRRGPGAAGGRESNDGGAHHRCASGGVLRLLRFASSVDSAS